MSRYKTWQYWRDEWIKPVLYALVIALFIRTFIAQPFKIPSSSMEPTFIPGDRIFVNKFIYGAKIPFTNVRLPSLREPERGDIMVFRSPVERKKFLVKRLAGLPGDVVEVKNQHIEVPANSYYVLGDNSQNSVDSRYWGFVPAKNLAGKVFFIHWPIKRIRIVK